MRDLKPENIMLVPKQGDLDFVKILDFGLAKLAPETMEDSDGEGPEKVLTRHGSVFGTPRYMAPEQCIGDEVDGRADLYAFGLIMYEALTGLHPFDERDPRKMIKHQLFTPIPPMKARAKGVTIPANFEALVMRAIEKVRGKRHASATELLTELAMVCEREGILPPEPSARFAAPRLPTPAPGLGGRQLSPSPRGLPSEAMATQDVLDSEATQDLPPGNETRPPSPPPAADETRPPSPPPAAQDVPTQKPIVVPVDSVPTQPPYAAPAEGKPAPSPIQPALSQSPARRYTPALLVLVPLGLAGILLGLFSLRHSPSPGPPAKTLPSPPRPINEPTPAPPSALALQAELDRASTAGPQALLLLLQKHPSDGRLPRALAQAYLALGNGLEALRWQVKTLSINESSIYDGEILQAATRAMGTAESTESAIALLEHDFGTRGLDVLIALMNKPGPGHAKTRIGQSLTKASVRALASPAALIALDLSTATRCEAKHALLSRTARDGDQRTLMQLKALMVTRGCGALHRGDCWSCLRKDGALRSAISAITARASLAH